MTLAFILCFRKYRLIYLLAFNFFLPLWYGLSVDTNELFSTDIKLMTLTFILLSSEQICFVDFLLTTYMYTLLFVPYYIILLFCRQKI